MKLSHLGSLLLCFLSTSVIADETAVLELGTRRELFTDNFLIDQLIGVSQQLHRPQYAGKSLEYDKPWEGAYSGCVTILNDEDRLRAYYRGYQPSANGQLVEQKNELICYAESRDGGESWTKPNLGLFEVAGTKENNVILMNSVDNGIGDNLAPFIDNRPGVPAAEKYKAFGGLKAIYGLISADGIHWRPVSDEPQITKPAFSRSAFDSQNIGFWSEAEQCYVCYFRVFKEIAGNKPVDFYGWRWIARSTSQDFRTWSEPEIMTIVDGNGEEPNMEHYYLPWTQPYYRAPHIYISIPKRFVPFKAALPLEEGKKYLQQGSVDHYAQHTSDSIFMTSRGGTRYDRLFMEAFVRPGPSPQDWITRANSCAYGIVPSGEREISLFRYKHYSQPTNHLSRYTLRVDGFVSVHAPYSGGELITKPLNFSGNALELNFETSAAGSIQVEIQDESGQPIKGFSAADCLEARGDEIGRIIHWKGGKDLSPLIGQAVRLRFLMRDADLYSLRFVKE